MSLAIYPVSNLIWERPEQYGSSWVMAAYNDEPLALKWVKEPTRVFGIFFSYKDKGNYKKSIDQN